MAPPGSAHPNLTVGGLLAAGGLETAEAGRNNSGFCLGASFFFSLGQRYLHPSCSAEPLQSFLQEWQKKTECWLCDNQRLVLASREVLKDFLNMERPVNLEAGRHPLETCLSGYLLAFFASTRSQSVQPWSFYETGLSIISSCAFDEAQFFAHFRITTAQIAYTFYVLGLPYHLPSSVLQLQDAELGAVRTAPPWGLPRLEDAPLVIDIGMGLGADSRYFLSQGFRVLAVEANYKAIEVAMAVDWVKPLVLEGRLTFLHAAIAPPGKGGQRTTIFAFEDRPEQSNAQSWVKDFGGVAESVRTVECGDLLRTFGEAVYMKIDVESSTIDCLESLAESKRHGRELALPKFISMELEAASLFERFLEILQELGYLFYKACRQYVYSPAPCEQGRYSREVPGCGSGPFGLAASDYRRGVSWSPLAQLAADRRWVEEFEQGLDWFDLHAMRA
ncbi:unnamed protein product [Effrenium voratum]|uniref:Methyltransferase FkbM domain-containing protein n=1 Tax=Effrenium voratum TaxID=2562239 RepID=A0AA36JHK0_9DINO|nr:unnamed protein product [Effrenium voratum]